MKYRKCDVGDLTLALGRLNRKFKRNIKFKRLDPGSKRFTLGVFDSRGKGAKLSPRGRRTVSACWHAHGQFFDELFNVNPGAEIIALGKKITIYEGNWQHDNNIGSIVNPVLHSEACNCE